MKFVFCIKIVSKFFDINLKHKFFIMKIRHPFLIIFIINSFFISFLIATSSSGFQLISPNSDRLKLTFNKMDSGAVNEDQEQTPISIVSIIGTRFSGKSTLLNAMLSDVPSFEQKKFTIGNIASGTSGLSLIKSNLKAKGKK